MRPLRCARQKPDREGGYICSGCGTLPYGRGFCLLATGEKQIQLATLMIEHAEGVRRLFQHLAGHRNRIAQLFEVQGRDAFWGWQGNHLIVDEAEEVLD